MDKLEVKEALARASANLVQGKLTEAAKLCAAILDSAPRNARAFYLRAAVFQREGKMKEATEDACEAARLRPDLPALQVAAGSLLCREKCYAQALSLFQKALERDSDNVQYHLGAASALRKLGHNDEATAALLRAATVADGAAATATNTGGSDDIQERAQVYYKLGQHYRSVGKPNSSALAADAYSRCLELDPGHVLAAFWLAATRKLATVGGVGVQQESEDENDASLLGGVDGAFGSHAGATRAAGLGMPDIPPPTAAPREYVVGLYNSYAESFDSHLQGSLGYRTPTVIVENLALLFPRKRWKRCLDLGCGTGLSGQAVSSVCDLLVGVDLSPAMVDKAREKRVYHRLLVGDVTETVKRLCRETRRTPPAASATSPVASATPSPSLSSPRRRRGWEMPEDVGEEGGALEATASAIEAVREPGADTPVEEDTAVSEAAAVPVLPPPPPRSEGDKSWPGSIERCRSGSSPNRSRGRGELVLSCDVFGYIGDLRACFGAVRNLVDADQCSSTTSGPSNEEPAAAIFAFSAEALANTSEGGVTEGGALGDTLGRSSVGYELQPTGRYSHSHEYLETVCRDAGFRVLVAKDVILRKNAGVPVRGFVFITEAVRPVAPAP